MSVAPLTYSYCLYGKSSTYLPHEDLVAESREDLMLLARAEYSGSEGCYVEVAKWNVKRARWERYCFLKMFDREMNWSTAAEACRALVSEINGAEHEHARLIASLPDYSGE